MAECFHCCCVALRIQMELFRASDVMSTGTPVTIRSQENVAKLAKMLLRTEHSGFPVVKYDEETRTEVAYGLITRSDTSCTCFTSAHLTSSQTNSFHPILVRCDRSQPRRTRGRAL